MQAEAEPILDIRVVDEDSTAFVHYDHRDVGDAPLGYMVENRHTRIALLRRAEEEKNVTLLASTQVDLALERGRFARVTKC